jgi:hypothetical protein
MDAVRSFDGWQFEQEILIVFFRHVNEDLWVGDGSTYCNTTQESRMFSRSQPKYKIHLNTQTKFLLNYTTL